MKDLQTIALLLDFYGTLLTQRQQELIQAYYLDDLSLAEIADESGVSRQAVHDLIKRAEGALHEYEQRLGLVVEHRRRQETLLRLEEAVLRQEQAEALGLIKQLLAN